MLSCRHGTIRYLCATISLFVVLRGESLHAAQRPRGPEHQRLVAAGLHSLAGNHIRLYTDLPVSPAIQELTRAFDLAVPQWCKFFSVPERRLANWEMTAYLIGDRDRFRSIGVLPPELPPFLHGYQMGPEIWCYEQPSDYYRRHLLLHEGTHAFMNHFLGGAGPPWYMEGSAELLATHRWEDGALALSIFPRNREESSHWGRIKAVRDELAAGRGMTLRGIMQYDQRAHIKVQPYAWCWAACAFLHHHPDTQAEFDELRQHVRARGGRFSQRLLNRLGEDWPLLSHQWQMFTRQLDYGYDIERELFSRTPSAAMQQTQQIVDVAADRGWQSSGIRIEPGTTYELRAVGRYVIAATDQIWWCEPNGITIKYYNGIPLGTLIAAVVDEDSPPEEVTPLVRPQRIGLAGTLKTAAGGVLYLRVNDSPAELGDNRGTLKVRVDMKAGE